jgi:hypothetical protein
MTAKWLQRILYRLAGLAPGQYVILLEIADDGAQWLIAPAGAWENQSGK